MSAYGNLTQAQRIEQMNSSSQSDAMQIATAAVATQARTANASLLGAPATSSQTSIYAPTYVTAPVHQVQGNTRVNQFRFASYTNPTDDTLYDGTNTPAALMNPTGFSSMSMSSQSNGLTGFGGAALTSGASALPAAQTTSTVSHVGTGSYSASGAQGSNIAPPNQSRHYTYALN